MHCEGEKDAGTVQQTRKCTREASTACKSLHLHAFAVLLHLYFDRKDFRKSVNKRVYLFPLTMDEQLGKPGRSFEGVPQHLEPPADSQRLTRPHHFQHDV